MSVNEMFLDTAQLRHNVVSHAKSLGYTPRSVRSALGSISLSGDVTGSVNSITVPRGTIFNGSGGYKFNVINDYSIPVIEGTINSAEITVYEGKFISNSYTVDSGRQVYRIPNKSCDMTSLRVKVYKDSTLADVTTYTESKTLVGHDNTSAIYFTQEGIDEHFEVYFGDDIIGKKLEIGNVVELEYLKSSGDIANNISTMSLGSSVTNLTNISITMPDKTTGGAGIETIESIKKNAPYLYTAQNRTVTNNDYKSLLINQFSFINDIAVWGGEDNIPPEYGKVFISIDKRSGGSVNELEQSSILLELNKFKLSSILPQFVNPEYTNLKLNVNFVYDVMATSLSSSELESKISLKINEHNNKLSTFNTVYYNSDITTVVMGVDKSIISATVNHTAYKNIKPVTGSPAKYDVNFNNSIYHPHDYHKTSALKGVVSSNGFYIDDTSNVYSVEDDGKGVLQLLYTSNDGISNISNYNIGSVDYDTGIVIIDSLLILSVPDGDLQISVELNSFDVVPVRNDIIQIVNVDINGIKSTGKLNTQTNDFNYKTTPARL
jgi:hypothetical protein